MSLRANFIFVIVCLLLTPSLFAGDKPIIGVTMSYEERETYSDRVLLTMPTIDAVTAAGGIPVLLPPLESEADVEQFLKVADGFVFTGGADINPERYGRDKHETTNLLPVRRENFDLMFMEKVLESHKPVLGICLGMQEMNIACGGTLIQDIPSETDSQLIHRGEGSGHDVLIVENTKLHDALQGETFAVNSFHHQAVDDLGKGLIVTARSPDGIVEGIKKSDHPFALGVQWHPEHMTDEAPQLNIFKSLINASIKSKEKLQTETNGVEVISKMDSSVIQIAE